MACAASIGCGIAGCGSGLDPELAQLAARARWADRGPSSYELTVARSCECLQTGPVVVTVVQGEVAARHYTETGESVPSQYEGLFPHVDGLFALIDEARRAGVARLDVSYDAELGYPVRIMIDHYATYVDDEVFYHARDLTVTP